MLPSEAVTQQICHTAHARLSTGLSLSVRTSSGNNFPRRRYTLVNSKIDLVTTAPPQSYQRGFYTVSLDLTLPPGLSLTAPPSAYLSAGNITFCQGQFCVNSPDYPEPVSLSEGVFDVASISLTA